MKKIPTVFNREFENHKVLKVKDEIAEGCKEAFLNGTATIKIDGACCAIIEGKFYKRYDAKKGNPPDGAIPCCEPDATTGHWPHWVAVKENDSADKWFIEAYKNTTSTKSDGTYEAVGRHFNGDPYDLPFDVLVRHGTEEAEVERTIEGVKRWLKDNEEEGLVFWLDGEPVCKIKRSDFGMKWPVKKRGERE